MEGYAEVNRLRLHYEAAGSGRAVLLIHGHYLDLRVWDRTVPALVRQYRTVRLDLRGHGRTEMPVLPYSHVGDIRALMDFLGLDSVCLVGHSLGADVAVDFSLRHRDRVAALALVSPYLRGHPASAPHRQRLERFAAIARQHGPARARRAWLEKDDLLAPVRDRPDVYARIAEIAAAFTFTEAMRPALERAPDASALHRLQEIHVPALLVVGEKDAPDVRAVARALHGTIPNARTTVIPEAGHWPQLEQPEAFNWTLLDFLRRAVDHPAPPKAP